MSDPSLVPPFHLSRTPLTIAELFACALREPETFGAVVEIGEGHLPCYVTCALARAMYPAVGAGQA